MIRRTRRFLADVRLADGTAVRAHCPNPGAMTTCCECGQRVLLSDRGSVRRKLRYTWEIARAGNVWIGVNPGIANRVVGSWIESGRIPTLLGPARAEPRHGRSRFDFELPGGALVEVKSVTLCRDGIAAFPDARTERGTRHLRDLARLSRRGRRCVLFYFVTRPDAIAVRPADEIDPEYGRALRAASRAGVEILAIQARFSRRGVAMGPSLDVML